MGLSRVETNWSWHTWLQAGIYTVKDSVVQGWTAELELEEENIQKGM